MSRSLTCLHDSSVLTAFPERLEECIGQLSMLSSISLVLPMVDVFPWFSQHTPGSVEHHIKRATKILKHFRGGGRPRNVTIKFMLATISTLGCAFSRGDSSMDPCEALEELLLTLPASNVQVHVDRSGCGAGRADFWSPVIKSAFPKLDEQGHLTFLQSKSNVIHLYHCQLTVNNLLPKPPLRAQTFLAMTHL